jgi:hypothetical protein
MKTLTLSEIFFTFFECIFWVVFGLYSFNTIFNYLHIVEVSNNSAAILSCISDGGLISCPVFPSIIILSIVILILIFHCIILPFHKKSFPKTSPLVFYYREEKVIYMALLIGFCTCLFLIFKPQDGLVNLVNLLVSSLTGIIGLSLKYAEKKFGLIKED